ncbi:MAG: L-2-hydroxyglutarate oxidase [Cytophagales bacterium]|nr:L-2-hydroxyglutarate oxidase [Cytophagales bacterium]MCA6389046.1 L-2-hydroxyglutarate oxidase [Cytophagales bacterium]MCA6392871.1 L-2-hydroxyglutarate oxidase [Cytophagales bacterium]MCA6396741.1 L-2-hydroxyglutarate oxidase [Cytophagales bacterium]MCA6400209.1 L-2-hydroxyglutarate oxidase [Cytophagales bacterium]
MNFDVIIVGGGIVGLATALQIKKTNPTLRFLVLEKENELAKHQTGNNSGVIHSGIYYKPGSLKATNCFRGYQLLIDFCREHEVPFELCGKLIVATDEHELPLLQTLFTRGEQNGLTKLKKLVKEELKEHEPHVAGIAGIFVPQTGIVDYKLVAEAYGKVLQKEGAEIHLGERVVSLKKEVNKTIVVTDKQDYEARVVINCAGLYSDKVAAMTVANLNVKIIPFRGEYFKLKKEKEYLVKNLIYPVPDPNFPFLGVHFTRMAKGGVEAGPNAVLAFKREGYKKSQINLAELAETLAWPGFQKVAAKYWKTGMGEMYRSFSKAAFTKALQKLIPEIQESDLTEGGAGVRAQACDREGGLVDDFLIIEDANVIHVCNAPSPAATSSLAIGETIAQKAAARL